MENNKALSNNVLNAKRLYYFIQFPLMFIPTPNNLELLVLCLLKYPFYSIFFYFYATSVFSPPPTTTQLADKAKNIKSCLSMFSCCCWCFCVYFEFSKFYAPVLSVCVLVFVIIILVDIFVVCLLGCGSFIFILLLLFSISAITVTVNFYYKKNRKFATKNIENKY